MMPRAMKRVFCARGPQQSGNASGKVILELKPEHQSSQCAVSALKVDKRAKQQEAALTLNLAHHHERRQCHQKGYAGLLPLLLECCIPDTGQHSQSLIFIV